MMLQFDGREEELVGTLHMILFTATASFVMIGLLDIEYAAICLALGFMAALVGLLGLL